MPLSDIIDRAIRLNTVDGSTDPLQARDSAIFLIGRNKDATREAVSFCAMKLIHDHSTRLMRKKSDERQGALFDLRARYATDNEGRVIKDTEKLTQLEFKRILKRREKQLFNDEKHLKALQAADKELTPIWVDHPDKLFGEVERLYLAAKAAHAATVAGSIAEVA